MIFKTYITPTFGGYPLADITPLLVRNWQNELLKHDLKPRYLRAINVQLSAVLNYAVKYYGLQRNPAALAGSIGTLKQQKVIQFYTLDQFRKFVPCLPEKYRIIFKILFFTGIRIGELLALTIKDFDLDAGTLDINKTFSDKLKITQPPITPKSKRIVTLPPFLIQEISDYIASKFYEPQPGERLFFWLAGKEILRYTANNAAAAAGLPRIRIHDFRHSHASLLINLDFPPLVVSERLGHESVKTTLEIYSHLYPDRAATVAEKLEKLKI